MKMSPFSCEEVAQAVGGRLRSPAKKQVLTGVSTDSRNLGRQDLFVALRGPLHDAHRFIRPEMQPLPGGVVVEEGRIPPSMSLPMIEVEDTRRALGDLAQWYRSLFQIPIIGITGSNGKTSTKAFLHAALSHHGVTESSPASFNNDIGVPLTLCRLNSKCEYLVVEIGTNHPGEIAHLSHMARPTHGIVTSIGGSHLGHFGSLDAIEREKGALAESLSESGWLFLNGDCPKTSRLGARTKARVVSVGTHPGMTFQIDAISVDAKGTSFAVHAAGFDVSEQVRLPVPGRHQAINAGLAFAAGVCLGADPKVLCRGLEEASLPGMRMAHTTVGSLSIWNDAYNANEDSSIAAMETFEQVSESHRRKVCVLGELMELGDHAEGVYQRLGIEAVKRSFDCCVAIGQGTYPWFETIHESSSQIETHFFESTSQAVSDFSQWVRPDDQWLMKASRGAHLEELLPALKSHSTVTDQETQPRLPLSS